MDSKAECESSHTSICERVEFILNIINQMCIGFVTIYISWMYLRTGLAGTALHAWLATIGFSFLMAEAIMCHYNQNVLTFKYRRNTKTLIHWVLQVLGGGIGIAGVLIQCVHDKFDLFNTHAKLGFAAFILCCISFVSGLLSLFSTTLRGLLSPLLNKTFHTILGIGTFAVALCAQYYGYETGLFIRNVPSTDFVMLMKCLTLISLVLSCLGPLKALFYKISAIFYQYRICFKDYWRGGIRANITQTQNS